MTYKYSDKSEANLQTCVLSLQRLFREVIKHYDCSILCGHRHSLEQQEAFNKGTSKLQYPDSKHNQFPSRAVDVVPYPINWTDTKRFYHFVGFVQATAVHMGIKIRSGVDWDRDNDLNDQGFVDAPHFELVD